MDSDRDGRVTAVEIQAMLEQLGISLSEEIVLDLVRQASQSGKLKFSFQTAYLFMKFYCIRVCVLVLFVYVDLFNSVR